MRVIMLMFDSLNKNMLSPYGGDWIKLPNFLRLAEKTVQFNKCYAGSLPCIPARRELHTGRYNFLHRIWGPLEPFDDSAIQMMRFHKVYTHLITDHWHYWEEGGATYHTRFNSWENVRGQEGEPWKGQVADPEIPTDIVFRKPGPVWRQDFVNRQRIKKEEDFPLAKTMNLGLEFLETNHGEQDWFLQLECFSPHEPFHVPDEYLKLYEENYNGPHFDWIPYREVEENEEQVQHIRNKYAALLTMCDVYLGKLLDFMDEHDMWKDTMLIVNTDHGLLLSEHNLWGKNAFPHYNELANVPLFIWNPNVGKKGETSDCLVQTIDLAPTLLNFFGLKPTKDMTGYILDETMKTGKSVREDVLFGCFGLHMNYTDGRYVYMRAPRDDKDEYLYNYTLLPLDMKVPFEPQYIKTMERCEPLSFTKEMPVMKFRGHRWISPSLLQASDGSSISLDFSSLKMEDLLFDLETDPRQLHPIQDEKVEKECIEKMKCLLDANDAPKELYTRLAI